MEKRGCAALVVALAVGCGSSVSVTTDDAGGAGGTFGARAEGSSGWRAHAADASPGVDAGPVCACSVKGPCCDGCNAIQIGEPCDDGLECSLASACQSDGTCSGASDACDYRVTEPQCQVVTCAEGTGCSAAESIREGLPCDDGDPDTVDDRCDDGACIGLPCVCDEKNECCDGCRPIAEGEACSKPVGSLAPAKCTAGVCVGRPCECTTGVCCDGCGFLGTSTVCRSQHLVANVCVGPNSSSCLGLSDNIRSIYEHTLCSGASADCSGRVVQVKKTAPCKVGTYCTATTGPLDYCVKCL